jgi:hypothetical protein
MAEGIQPRSTSGQVDSADRRLILAAQLRLLALRSERGFPLDIRSINNLFRAFRAVLFAELSA